MTLPTILTDKHPLPWRLHYAVRFEWHPKSQPCVLDANGKVVLDPPRNVDHPGLEDPLAEALCQTIIERVNQTAADERLLGAADQFYSDFQDYINEDDYELPDCGSLGTALEALGVELPGEPGDDVCDLCMTSKVHADRTTYCGKTIGIECGCEEENEDGTCGSESCEACQKGANEDG